MGKIKCAVLLFSAILALSCNIYADDLMTDEGETMEDLGEGEAMTTSGELIVDEGGSGDYLMGSGETLRDTGSED